MGFIRTAEAAVIHTGWTREQWGRIRDEAKDQGGNDRLASVNEEFRHFDPSKYLLSHLTIMCSVDVEESPLPLGKFNSSKIKSSSLTKFLPGYGITNRNFSDFLVKPEHSKYVNGNGDCWERKLLLSAYKTFIGGANYYEHLQVPELNKGIIVDAVARDVGDTIYIDLLKATDRKHTYITEDLESDVLNTASMGCNASFAICTRCGNVAIEDTDVCDCVSQGYKLSYYTDNDIRRIVAELIGHWSDPNSCVFFESSWVRNPAFKGAVKRKILTPLEVNSSSGVPITFPELRVASLTATRSARVANLMWPLLVGNVMADGTPQKGQDTRPDALKKLYPQKTAPPAEPVVEEPEESDPSTKEEPAPPPEDIAPQQEESVDPPVAEPEPEPVEDRSPVELDIQDAKDALRQTLLEQVVDELTDKNKKEYVPDPNQDNNLFATVALKHINRGRVASVLFKSENDVHTTKYIQALASKIGAVHTSRQPSGIRRP